MRILSIDDKDENRYLIEVLLRGSGYEVQSAANGAEALELLRAGRYDLIISDILMPVMDGFELCRTVKTDPLLRDIPLIFYTATYTGPQDEAFAKKVGADGFVVKPCEPETFLTVVRETLATARNHAEKPAPKLPGDEEVFKLYNERLVRKLEQKMLQLEQETKALREAEKALRISEGKYRRLHESMADGFVFVDMEGRILECNEAYRRMLGYSAEELLRFTYQELTPAKWHALEQDIVDRQVLVADCSEVYEKEYITKDGQIFPVELKTFLLRKDSGEKEGMWAIVRDLTERKKAEKSRRELESQLHQAQKMESIGRLAGGVAHDYNNMLSVILGYAELSLAKTSAGTDLHSNLTEILDAAKRSADITRQLLAFARKQAVEPQILDLNSTVEGMLRILQRLTGEDLELKWLPRQGLQKVNIDPSQVVQILANLCVNARDAITGQGRVIIETANIFVDPDYCRRHANASAGDYVLLAVSDNGCGMDRDIMEKIFEPFFTTKGPGRGTGLGLATVYGIVKQNNGLIDVYSEPDKGTTFKIFLPQHTAGTDTRETQSIMPIAHGQGKTILVVEDEAAILRLASRILLDAGYRVLTANSPNEAIDIVSDLTGRLDLLVSDVVMPEMNGRDLEQRLLALRPELKSLFMSGYAAGFIADRGLLAEGINFIQKPFTAESLTIKVQQILTTRAPAKSDLSASED